MKTVKQYIDEKINEVLNKKLRLNEDQKKLTIKNLKPYIGKMLNVDGESMDFRKIIKLDELKNVVYFKEIEYTFYEGGNPFKQINKMRTEKKSFDTFMTELNDLYNMGRPNEHITINDLKDMVGNEEDYDFGDEDEDEDDDE